MAVIPVSFMSPADPAVGPLSSGAFVVSPIVDYEPPTHNAGRRRPGNGLSARAATGRHRASGTARRGAPAPDATGTLSAPMRQAAAFADTALRRVLEVIDRRRPVASLRPLLAPGLIDAVSSIGRTTSASSGAAILRRTRVQPVGPRDPDTAAEVSGSYSRGQRIHAIACRVEQVHNGGANRWQVVALHIG